MNVFFLFTGGGSLVILTSYSSVEDPGLLRKLAAKGIEKFLAYQIPITLAKERYGRHFDIVSADLSESDDLRVLDFDGTRAFRLFRFHEMGSPIAYEPQLSKQGCRSWERLPISNRRTGQLEQSAGCGGAPKHEGRLLAHK